MSEKLTEKQYEDVSGAARKYFGRYAGYAQQFLYYHMRQDAGKKW
jgi:N-glycosylase/DNA lyase